jgi:hypothetical protein
MTALTRFVLRHKALVVLFWVAVTAAAIMTVSATTHRLTNSFAMPGPAFRTDSQIVAQYGNGGSQAPYVPVLTAPGGQRADSPATMVALFGRFNWWLPAPLARLLRVPAGPAGPAPVAAPEEEAVREMDTVAMLSR